MAKGLDYDYMRKHLLDYSVLQIHQGYHPEEIRSVLMSYGYHKDVVEDIYNAIKDIRPEKRAHVAKGQIGKDLYYYVQNMLVDFISKEIEAGYDLEIIRKALINYGHQKEMVDTAVKAYETGEVLEWESPEVMKLPQQLIFALSLVFVLVMIVLLSISTDENLLKVLLAFMPAIFSLILVNFVKLSLKSRQLVRFLPIFSILLSIGIFYLLMSFSKTMQGISEPELVIVLNVVISFIFSSFICLFSNEDIEEIITLEEKHEDNKFAEKKKKPEEKKESELPFPDVG